MQIKFTQNFEKNFYIIYEFIAQDKLSAAKNFKSELLKIIKDLPSFPFKNRKSFYFEEENIRDMIFMGYTIVYEIDTQKQEIIIFTIFNQNKPAL